MEPKTEIRLSQVDGELCTHIIMAFARINANCQLIVANETTDYAYLDEVPHFKRRYPHVRVMISVCNDQEFSGIQRLASTLNSNDNRLKFARSAVEFLQRYHLDGIDLDWQFPNFSSGLLNLWSGREQERTGLTKIVKSLRSAIVENFYDRQLAEQNEFSSRASSSLSSATGRLAASGRMQAQFEPHVEPYLLTVAIGGQEAILRASYELTQLANLCDWLNVMSYDYFLFKAYSPFTGPNSPLYPIVDPYVPILSKLSLSWTVSRLLDEGLDGDKLVVGVPCYARAYALLFRNTQPAPFTLSAGTKGGQIDDCLNYREIVELLRREDTIVGFDERARVPYLLTDNGYTWISYENCQSVREKVHYILERGLGGYMTWNLNSDDFVGCSAKAKAPIKDQESGTVEGQNGLPPPPAPSATGRTAEPEPTFPLHRAMLDEVNRYFARP